MKDRKDPKDIVIEITKDFEGIEVDLAKFEKLVHAVCDLFDITKAVISIAIVGDAQISKVNAKFLNHDYRTDVISFDLSDCDTASKVFDLVVNAQMAIRQAQSRPHCPEAELALYITHGLLHNLGFDDLQPEQAKKMHETEDKILQQHGFGLVYNS